MHQGLYYCIYVRPVKASIYTTLFIVLLAGLYLTYQITGFDLECL